MKFLSHKQPDKLLKVHLQEVADYACDNALYQKEIQIASIMHDFGKYTTYFQDYLITEKETHLSQHGFLSAIAAAYVALKEFSSTDSVLAVYSSILHHHGNLKTIDANLPKRRNQISPIYDSSLIYKIKNVKIQIDDIKNNIDKICNEYSETGYSEVISHFITNCPVEETLKQLKDIRLKCQQDYFKNQYIYSKLIFADKISASNTKLPIERFAAYNILNLERVKVCNEKNHINRNLNKIRSEIFKKVQETITLQWNKSDIYTITSPTGTGKTYTGFFAALKLRELMRSNGKIIYALPFTSIITQNYISLKRLFENAGMTSDSYILMHHHLGDYSFKQYTSTENFETEVEDYTITQAQLLIESWNSGVIITTFVQLFETLLGVRNKMLKKFHCLENSIILIDEFQSVDIKFHKIIEELLTNTIQKLNCKVIFMTATKPAIFSTATELLCNYEYYYKLFNRTRLLINLTPINCDEFIETFLSRYDEKKSYLIVCNTINQSLYIYEKLKSALYDKDLFYLSNNIIPAHRKNVINKVDQMLRNKTSTNRPILISTQVVEAGVDLDFDEVYRDIAPLDSIIQCAGRCNRNNRICTGNVHVICIKEDNTNLTYASRVYKQNWLNLTQKVLENKKVIDESDYLELINSYFQLLKHNTSDTEYKKLKRAIEELDFDIIREFSLIENNNGYIDVFIIVDGEAERVFADYNKALSFENIKSRQEALLALNKKVLSYTISVPVKFKSKFSLGYSMYYLPQEASGENGLYCMKTGFNRLGDFDQFF